VLSRRPGRIAGEALPSASATRASLELKNVCKGYGEAGERQQVVDDISIKVEAGGLTALVGPSGCGKSTLVGLIAGFDRPDKGQVLLNGKPISGPSHDRMVVFQETALLPWLTTYENVVFGPKLRGELKGAALRDEALRLLKRVGLTEFKDKYPLQLSGGMQRRAELARAMINQPLVMIMDEPFRGLDAMTRELMQEFYLRLFEETRRTNLFVTSEIEEAIFLADRLVVLSNRPARVRDVVEVPLPRPRDYRMLNSPEAYAIKRQVLEILHEEALRSFQQTAGRSDLRCNFARLALEA
jgi:NitT/TauT family transport system ATP-binding protein